jgi:integrase/recombinase XerD
MMGKPQNGLPETLSGWVLDYLQQLPAVSQNVSAHTVASYRDTLRLLLDFMSSYRGQPVATLSIADLDEKVVLAFLSHLEHRRRNCARSRNVRLATVRSFAHYAAMREPGTLCNLSPVFAIAAKPFVRRTPDVLSRREIRALLEAPDPRNFDGRRDRALLTTIYHTAARVSEITAARCEDLHWRPTAYLSIHGRGSRERTVTLSATTAELLQRWLRELGSGPDAPLFPNQSGEPMTRSGIERRVKVASLRAADQCHSLRGRTVSPNVIRRSAALHLLEAGVDMTVVGLRLGHSRIDTTQNYVLPSIQMRDSLEGISMELGLVR